MADRPDSFLAAGVALTVAAGYVVRAQGRYVEELARFHANRDRRLEDALDEEVTARETERDQAIEMLTRAYAALGVGDDG